eukprot:CAMPEP_0184496798 /NCGR_PEP_ID=MMETSP0113_2-20130426/34895_1 /TAXON_ID=91329 /ORGANISM="Norrisiella sphaerica, Strain BC52" /LENGTH=172 /DNA_ID=CAMNT_0026883599 /DNA_START=396 /DNA_END=914 /DNA_ORIENTATION=-
MSAKGTELFGELSIVVRGSGEVAVASKYVGYQVKLAKYGTGLKALMKAFDNSEMQWGMLGVLCVDDSSSVKSIHSKLVQIDWCGTGVREGDKGKMINKQRPLVQAFAGSIACNLPARAPEDLNARKVAYKLFHAQGAHKPSHYDFGDEKVQTNGLTTFDDNVDDEDEDEDFA